MVDTGFMSPLRGFGLSGERTQGLRPGLTSFAPTGLLDRGYGLSWSALRWFAFVSWFARGEILRVAQRVSKKKEVEVSRQGRNCHSSLRSESLWRRT